VIQTYTQELPERIPLAENKEFKSIKNMIIREAMQLKTVVRMDEPEEIKDMENVKIVEDIGNHEGYGNCEKHGTHEGDVGQKYQWLVQ